MPPQFTSSIVADRARRVSRGPRKAVVSSALMTPSTSKGIAGKQALTEADVAYLHDRSLRFVTIAGAYAGTLPPQSVVATVAGRNTVALMSAVALAGDDVAYSTRQPSVGWDPAKQYEAYYLVLNNIQEWANNAFAGPPPSPNPRGISCPPGYVPSKDGKT